MPDFAHRATTPELMDSDADGFADYAACLADLAQVNAVTLTHRPTRRFLDRLLVLGRIPRDRPLRILDLAAGYGDGLRRLGRWAARRGVAVELAGLDLNPWAAEAARAATPPGRRIRWLTGDVFADLPGAAADIVVTSQFSHHLADGDVVRLLRRMEALAGLAWCLVDLHRHPVSYHVFRHGARLAGWHRFVQHDGPVSITRGFTAPEWRRLIAAAGLEGAAELSWHLPFRHRVCRVKP